MHKAIDAGNAVPVYLAAVAHGAKQLEALCMYRMSVDMAKAQKHEQWAELSEVTKKEVAAAHTAIVNERQKRKKEKEMLRDIPCLLAPPVQFTK